MSLTEKQKRAVIRNVCEEIANPKRDWIKNPEVRLTDVLIALWERKGQAGFLKAADLIFPGALEHWQLYEDDLDSQYEETIDFIFDLLANGKNA